jgi:hypothetical protein
VTALSNPANLGLGSNLVDATSAGERRGGSTGGGSSVFARSVAPDFFTPNFESVRLSIQRFLDPVSPAFERRTSAAR